MMTFDLQLVAVCGGGGGDVIGGKSGVERDAIHVVAVAAVGIRHIHRLFPCLTYPFLLLLLLLLLPHHRRMYGDITPILTKHVLQRCDDMCLLLCVITFEIPLYGGVCREEGETARFVRGGGLREEDLCVCVGMSHQHHMRYRVTHRSYACLIHMQQNTSTL